MLIDQPEYGMAEERAAGPEKPMLEARYANHFNLGYNAFEVILEFGQAYEGQAPAVLHTRIVTTPMHAKGLLELLRDSLDDYERDFGKRPRETER
jgi:hypothetical protein